MDSASPQILHCTYRNSTNSPWCLGAAENMRDVPPAAISERIHSPSKLSCHLKSKGQVVKTAASELKTLWMFWWVISEANSGNNPPCFLPARWLFCLWPRARRGNRWARRQGWGISLQHTLQPAWQHSGSRRMNNTGLKWSTHWIIL